MNIAPIARINPTPATAQLKPLTAAEGAGGNFADMVSGALETVNASQGKADGMAQQAATGQLKDVHEYMIAATEASLSTELTVAVRNRAVEAFNDIMRMTL